MSLDILIAPHSRESFFEEVWEKRALHVARNDPDYFGFLREDLSVEQVIWQTCHSWGDVSLARAHTNYQAAPYAALPPGVSTIRKALADDYTVVINNVERKSLRVAEFCRSVEKNLYFNAIVNLYFTKANTQGLNYHYDTEDVFILQLEGKKEWRIYDVRADLPLTDEIYQQPDCDSCSFQEFQLCAGDVLYIPRGFVHEAHALDHDSLHLTLTVSVVRWASVLHNLIDIASRHDVEFRKAVEVDLLRTSEVSPAHSIVNTLLKRISAEEYLSLAISEIQDRLLADKARLPAIRPLNGTADDDVQVGSVVGVAPDQVHLLSRSREGALFLKFIGASIEVSDDLEEVIRFVCQRKTFIVEELPGAFTAAEKVGLIKRLVDCGFLTVYPVRHELFRTTAANELL